ncbi:hypothetical protein JTB14_016885 [Gonioctena quinquepunctata]|nr:hypothetical protein JTB14_016885 [Gonioctena quinquepunctata]
MRASIRSLENGALIPTLAKQNTKTKFQWWRSASTVNLESSVNIFDADTKGDKVYNELTVNEMEPTSKCQRFLAIIIKIFDLTLMKDYTYCSIMLGISLSISAEIDFSVSLPFILSEFGMTSIEIAEFLSIVGIADIVFRFLASYIGDFLKQPRILHIFSLIVLIIVRSLIAVTENVNHLFSLAVVLGAAKGIRSVFLTLTLPSYVPLKRLASASGIQMVFNGLFVVSGGTFFGYVRDATGDYRGCIHFLNCMTLLVVIMWSIELILTRSKTEDTPRNSEEGANIFSDSDE